MSMLNVLIIEDRPEIRYIWKKYLSDLPIRVDIREAPTLREGVLLSRKIPPPDLILLDLRLEDSHTPENTIANQELLKSCNPNVVLVTISGYITPEIAELTVAKGAHGFIRKQEIERSSHLWEAIQAAISRAPAGAQKAMCHTSDIICQLTKALKHQ